MSFLIQGMCAFYLYKCVLLIAVLASLINSGVAICYFPQELQGMWATQTVHERGSVTPLTYSMVTIKSDSISLFGQCHSKSEENTILVDRLGSGSFCFRCLRILVASPNVVAIYTMGFDVCHGSERDAVTSCPSRHLLSNNLVMQIMLYKVRSVGSERGVTQVECPFNGIFTFTYVKKEEAHRSAEMRCDHRTSELSNCPYGFGLNVRYRDCSFVRPIREGLQCLGSWRGFDGKQYLSVWDNSVSDTDGRPKYKCGIYEEEAGSGKVYLAFSEDSTCDNGLYSARDGHEQYALEPVPATRLPPDVTSADCEFPRGLVGHWHHTHVGRDTFVFKDRENFKTYSAHCVRSLGDGERYIVYVRNHCGDWSYNCLRLKRRSANVLEHMLALESSEVYDNTLCDAHKFGDDTFWSTSAKSVPEVPTVCPIVGSYEGMLPASPGFCAQLYSDCERPELMFYSVNECSAHSTIYEMREYKCLGQWEEDSYIYVYTYRVDIGTYECFVGVMQSDGSIYIMEAGSSCSRINRPEVFGMQLHKIGNCSIRASPGQSILRVNRNREALRNPPPTKPAWIRTTPRSWHPITAPPRTRLMNSTQRTPCLNSVYVASSLLISLVLAGFFTT